MPKSAATLYAHDNRTHFGILEIGPWPRAQGLCGLPDLTVHPGRRLSGSVRGIDGEPLPNAAVVVRGTGVERQVLADEGGAFAFDGLPPGEYAVDVLPDHGTVAARRFVRVEQDDVGMGRIDLQPAVSRVVRLVDSDQDYLAGLHVVAFEADSDRRAYGVSDSTGAVSLGGLGPGGLSFQIPRTGDTPDSAGSALRPSVARAGRGCRLNRIASRSRPCRSIYGQLPKLANRGCGTSQFSYR